MINEDALISAMEALLKERGKDEQLVVFRSEDYPDLAVRLGACIGVWKQRGRDELLMMSGLWRPGRKATPTLR